MFYRKRNERARAFGSDSLGVCVGVWCIVALATGALAPGASAQEGGGPAKLSVRVLDTSADYQHLTVPLNKSVIVETSVAAARVDVVAAEVVGVTAISPSQLLVTGNSYGTTNVIIWDDKDKQYIFEVTVELDVEALNEAVQRIDPLADVQARSVLGNIVLTGTVSSADSAARIVELTQLFIPPSAPDVPATIVQNHLDVAGEQQVRLQCVVAEISRSGVRQLGINGFLAGENFRDAFFINQIGGVNPIDIGAAGSALATNNIPFLTDASGIPVGPASTLSLGFPRAQMQLFIKALADNSLLKILAEPNLVAISGEEASFLAGGEFPIPVPQGNQQVTIEFREFGVRLNFTPVVRGQQQIRVAVRPEVSELDFSNAVQFQGLTVPGLTSRSAKTTIEVGSGQTFVIAGLLNEQIRGIVTRVPGMGDLPVLGALFRSVDFRRSLTELVILVTPEIVAPLDPHQYPTLPGDGYTAPSDYELYGKGLLDGAVAVGEEPEPEETTQPDEMAIHGPWGHEDG